MPRRKEANRGETALESVGYRSYSTVPMTDHADSLRLTLFTLVWTAVWVAPLPRLGRWPEFVAGIVPFAAFGLRVFAGFFTGVPEEDPVRSAVRPLLDWIDGRRGLPPYAWTLDATVALGLVWIASAFDIPRRSRIATAWIIPAVAALAWWSTWSTGLPIERLLTARLPAPLVALAAGSAIGGVIRWTASPLSLDLRRRAAAMAILTVPMAVFAGLALLWLTGRAPPEHASQARSIAALSTGVAAAVAGRTLGGFTRPRSRWLFAMAVGVAAGAIVARAG